MSSASVQVCKHGRRPSEWWLHLQCSSNYRKHQCRFLLCIWHHGSFIFKKLQYYEHFRCSWLKLASAGGLSQLGFVNMADFFTKWLQHVSVQRYYRATCGKQPVTMQLLHHRSSLSSICKSILGSTGTAVGLPPFQQRKYWDDDVVILPLM